MKQSAYFRFFGALNDFLRLIQKEVEITYYFDGTPAVKDAIEAIGVPHPEVWQIRINGSIADFYTRLQPGDQVEVYPAEAPVTSNKTEAKFILDVHLGKLARSLRMLGFDTKYENNYTDKTIAAIAVNEDRIVLTRDVDLLKNKAIARGYWLRSQHAEEQLAEVILYFGLGKSFKPFVRCMVCNGLIQEVTKEEVWDRLPPKTKLYFDEFYQCSNCKRVYWKGTHYERMLRFISQLQEHK